MNSADNQYLAIADELLAEGEPRQTRNGIRHTKFGTQMRFDLFQGFPLLTSKSINFHNVKAELLWFLRGDTNVKFLHTNNVHIWDEWADEHGNLGPVYGSQWRSWPTYREAPQSQQNPIDTVYRHDTIDQIANVIKSLRDDPYGTRHIVTAWNPAEIGEMALPPCHMMFQFDIDNAGSLSCQMYQRSADWFLGVPYNIASYALLTHIIAMMIGRPVGEFIHTFGNYHLYDNHCAQAATQISRRLDAPPLPKLILNPEIAEYKDPADVELDDILLMDYIPLPAIKAPISK